MNPSNPTAPSETSGLSPRTGLSVLVAEDEPMIQRAISRFLERRGHEVRVASTAYAALQLIGIQPPDAALVDVRMPGGGLSVVRALSGNPDFGGQIVLMTGGHSEDHAADIDASVAFLPKPFSLTRLAAVLEGHAPSSSTGIER